MGKNREESMIHGRWGFLQVWGGNDGLDVADEADPEIKGVAYGER